MDRLKNCAAWAIAVVALAFSPAIVTLGVPLACGIGCDVARSIWLSPIALLAATAIGLNAWRRDAPQAAKSIT